MWFKNLSIPKRHLKLIKAIAKDKQQPWYMYNLKKSDVGRQILDLSRKERAELVISMTKWLGNKQILWSDIKPWQVRKAMLHLLRHKLPFAPKDVVTLLSWSESQNNPYLCGAPQMIKVVENYLKEQFLTSEMQEKIEAIVINLESGHGTSETRRWTTTRLKNLGKLRTNALPIVRGEAWADAAIQDIEAMDTHTQAAWLELLDLCVRANGAKPSAKWQKSAKMYLEQIGDDAFQQAMLKWFPLVDKARTEPIVEWPYWGPDPNLLIDVTNGDILKGLAWICANIDDPELARSVTNLAMSAYRKVPDRGARCVRLGNACIWALGQMPTEEGMSQLAFLKVKIKLNSAQKSIEKALTAAAERTGLPRNEIEEMIVPTYGLEKVGLRQEVLGEFTAKVVVTGTKSVELRWIRPDGKSQKSVPKVIRENHTMALKELRQVVKDIKKMLPAQRDRIESLYLQQKSWEFSTWRERYLDHPLIGTLTRRIIWQFSDGDRAETGIWYNDQIVSYDGFALDWLDDSTQVELWHPINSKTETIIAWRNWLVEHMVQQPFKQAHREIYLLTDAERNTQIYSNRYAAHIIRQHQFNALCGARGWKNQLRLMVDDFCPPATRLMPEWGLRAEFWADSVGDDYGADTTVAGTYLYLATDQVRFYTLDAPEHASHAIGGGYHAGYFERRDPAEPIPVDEIPPLVFTEIMRDVDLFVGVASVGNDPTWADGGLEGRFRDYWESFSFGNLSESAKTRKQVLEGLLPRLQIADRCKLTNRFLTVRGDIRTYKIHLGSGNIMMTPMNQYLCIVPGRGAARTGPTGQLFLPFEGDTMLAIILSKAFMLAEDTKIKDPTILHQIGG